MPIRALRIAALAAAGVGAGVLLLPFLIDAGQFRALVEEQIENATGRDAALGAMRLQVTPLALRAEGFSLADDAAFSSQPFLRAARVDIEVGLGALLRRQVEIQRLVVRDPTIELIRNRAGEWNFRTIGRRPGTEGIAQPPKPGRTMRLALLDVRNGSIAVTDRTSARASAARRVYQNIDARLRDLTPGQPFALEVSLQLPGGQGRLEAQTTAAYDERTKVVRIHKLTAALGAIRANGTGALNLSGSPATADVELLLPETPIADLARLGVFPAGTRVAGKLAAQLRVQGPLGQAGLLGNMQARGVEVMQKGWREPVRTASLAIELTPQVVRFKPFTVESGATRLTASATIRDYGRKPGIEAALEARQARLEELLRMAAAYGVRAANNIGGRGRVSLDLRLAARGGDWDYSGSGVMEDVTLELPALREPLGIARAELRFTEAGVDLRNLAASVAGSQLQGFFQARNLAAPRFEFDIAIDKLDLARWQALANSGVSSGESQPRAAEPRPIERVTGGGTLRAGSLHYGPVTLTGVTAAVMLDRGRISLDPVGAQLYGGTQSGTITADLRSEPVRYAIRTRMQKVDANQLLSSATALRNVLSGYLTAEGGLEASPRQGEEFTRSLMGSLRFQLDDGKLIGLRLLNELARLAQASGFAGQAAPAPVTDVLHLSGTLQVQAGKASTNDLRLAFAGGSLEAGGSIGLADQSLQLKVLSLIDQPTSERMGGTRVGGYLSTVLANAKGELVIPCLVSGTLARPVFAPDPSEIARLKMRGLASEPGAAAAVGGVVVEAIREGRKDGGKGLGGSILDALRGKKKTPAAENQPSDPQKP